MLKRRSHNNLVAMLRQFIQISLKKIYLETWIRFRADAAMMIQKIVRAYLGKRRWMAAYRHRQETIEAAIKIQRMQRGILDRQAAADKRLRYINAVFVIQRCARCFLARAAVEHKALERYLMSEGTPALDLARRARKPAEEVEAMKDASLVAALDRISDAKGLYQLGDHPTQIRREKNRRQSLLQFAEGYRGGSEVSEHCREDFEDAITGSGI